METIVLEKTRFLPIVIWEAVEAGQNLLCTENARNHAAEEFWSKSEFVLAAKIVLETTK